MHKEISQVCGPVSSRIRLILEEVGYIHSGLAHLEEAEIAEIENAVRSFLFFLFIKFDNSFLVTKVYQFTYLSGKRKAYSGLTAPIEAPEGVERKGIGLRGNFFDLICTEGEYQLKMVEKSEKMCVEIENYVSHLEKPNFTSQGFVIYSGRSADNLSSKIV